MKRSILAIFALVLTTVASADPGHGGHDQPLPPLYLEACKSGCDDADGNDDGIIDDGRLCDGSSGCISFDNYTVAQCKEGCDAERGGLSCLDGQGLRNCVYGIWHTGDDTAGPVPASSATTQRSAVESTGSTSQSTSSSSQEPETFEPRCERVKEKHGVVAGHRYELVVNDVAEDAPSAVCVDLTGALALENAVLALVAPNADYDVAVWHNDADWQSVEKYADPHGHRHKVGESGGPHCVASAGQLSRDADNRVWRDADGNRLPKSQRPFAVDQVRLTDGNMRGEGLMVCAGAYKGTSVHTIYAVDQEAN